ncbi:MAG: VWA domain-containing protein [Phycisphaerae bacterium]|nr:VWA domain-containing protein [Phycisphaerae bacterium]
MTIFPAAIWIHFDNPAWLWAALAAVAPAATAWWSFRRGRAFRKGVVVLQSLALLLAAVSLAGLVLPRTAQPPGWLLLRDVSASVGRQGGVVLDIPADVEVQERFFAGRLLGGDERDDLDATHLCPVLDWSAAAVRAGRADGMILITDGQFQDDWQAVARRYAETHAPLWIVPLSAPPRDARISAFTVKPSAESSSDSADYDLAITAQSNASMRRTVSLYRISPGGEKRKLAQSEIVLEPNRPATIHLRDTLPRDAVGIWQAELTPHDELPQNDSLQTARRPAVLRIAWIAANNHPPKTLSSQKVVSLSPGSASNDPIGWLGYSAVVLADATGRLLSPQQRVALAEFVRGGGGLVLLGAGPHETPAEKNDPLNRILPLRADPFERNPLDLTVVLDASGSMAEPAGSPGRPKWSQAGEAVLSLREHLTPADRLRVIAFSDAARAIYDGGAAERDFAVLGEVLRCVSPAGATNIAPALEQVLQTPPAGNWIHLVLVLSDLQTAKFDAAEMAKRFRAKNIQLAVVATGVPSGAAKASLGQLAELLHAPVVYREHLQGLADVFGRLCRRARGETIRRGEFSPQYDSAWPAGACVKQIHAYIPAAAAGKAFVEARIEQTGDPLLAVSSAGLGRAAVVSAPPEAILTQPGGGELPAELLCRTLRPGDDGRFDVQATRDGDVLRIRATVRDGGRAVNGLALRAEVMGLSESAGEPITVELLQSAPGEYQADIPIAADGNQAVAVRVLEKPGRLCWQGIAAASYPAEFARLGANYETLRELAALTEGRIVEAAAMSAPAMREELRRPRFVGGSIWRITLTGAIVAMLLAWVGGRMKNKHARWSTRSAS